MKYFDLELAFDTVSSGGDIGNNAAFISKSTGKIVYQSHDVCSDEDIDLESICEDEDYVQVPDKFELELGQRLVWEFVRREVPGLEPKVREIFSKRGAYSRYKDFLAYNDLLQKWYDFESQMTKEALIDWATRNGIEVEDAVSR